VILDREEYESLAVGLENGFILVASNVRVTNESVASLTVLSLIYEFTRLVRLLVGFSYELVIDGSRLGEVEFIELSGCYFRGSFLNSGDHGWD